MSNPSGRSHRGERRANLGAKKKERILASVPDEGEAIRKAREISLQVRSDRIERGGEGLEPVLVRPGVFVAGRKSLCLGLKHGA